MDEMLLGLISTDRLQGVALLESSCFNDSAPASVPTPVGST